MTPDRTPAQAELSEPPCFGCASTLRERSACPECGKVLCQACAEAPSLLGYSSCCDALDAEATSEGIARARDCVANGRMTDGPEVEALFRALDARDIDLESIDERHAAELQALETEAAHHAIEREALTVERDELRDALGSVKKFRDQLAIDAGQRIDALTAERDAAMEAGAGLAAQVASCTPLMREAADRIGTLERELQALADAHAELVKAHATLSDENARLLTNNNNLATAILHGSERGQS